MIQRRQPYVRGCAVLLAILRRSCEPRASAVAEKLGIRHKEAHKILTTLVDADILVREKRCGEWWYLVKDEAETGHET